MDSNLCLLPGVMIALLADAVTCTGAGHQLHASQLCSASVARVRQQHAVLRGWSILLESAAHACVLHVCLCTSSNWPCSLTLAQVLRMEFTSADNAFMHNIAAFRQVRTAVVAFVVLLLPFD